MDPPPARVVQLGGSSPGSLARGFIDVFDSNINIILGQMPVEKMAAAGYLPRDELKCYIKSVCGRWIRSKEVFGTEKSQ
jgi:hypothetical protein